jgi:uncharacterized surface protein with fasciclin (FAS1) repeats
MANHFFSTRLFFISMILAGAVLTSCDDDDDDDHNGSASKTITEIVVNTNDFSTLEAAVSKAGLATTLNGTGPFTVFAPDNDAFESSGISVNTINTLSQDAVSGILLYHTLPARVTAADVPNGPNAKVITAGGDSVFVTRNANGVYINGTKVKQADIVASNGIIHSIEKVLIPPSGDIVGTAQAPESGLDSLVKAVVRANNGTGGNPALISTLQTALLTVFAPTNAAFTQLLADIGVNDIDEIPVSTLLAVLGYHIVPGRAFSSDLSNGNLSMLSGGNTTVNLTNGAGGGPTITGSGNDQSYSNISAVNIMASNGVIHKIDRVLLP